VFSVGEISCSVHDIICSESDEKRDGEPQVHAHSAASELGIDPTELHCQSDTLAFQNDLDPDFSITMIFRWSTTINQITVISATVEVTTIDWIGGGTHTPDTNPDQSADLRMHITGILYHSRAASLGMLSSIGGCVSRTTTTTVALATTTTSTHTALTTTTTRRQQLIAEFMSGA